MTTVEHLIQKKNGRGVISVPSDSLVIDAIRIMAENNIGALLVIDAEIIKGIITERDYSRKVILRNRSSRSTTVKHIMTKRVLYVEPDQEVEECMVILTERKVRHLPVI